MTPAADPHAKERARRWADENHLARRRAAAHADQCEERLTDCRDGADWIITTACLRELLRRAEERGRAAR